MVGDSLMHWAEKRATDRNNSNLSLDRQQYYVRWFGVRGMHWSALCNRLQYVMLFNKSPIMIIIHLGGNDIVASKLRTFQKNISKVTRHIMSTYAGIKIVWSDILPRLVWTGVSPAEYKGMERKRGCINRWARTEVASSSLGHLIVHNNMDHTPGLFFRDGIHFQTLVMTCSY